MSNKKEKEFIVRKVNINRRTGQGSITLPKKLFKRLPKAIKIVW